jgi:hypothetical protein
LNEAETYRAASRRAVRLLQAHETPTSREEAWNALYFAIRACTLTTAAGLTEAEWRVLEDGLARRAMPNLKENVALLTALIALRRDRHAAAVRALRGVKLPPWDYLVLALSHARHGRLRKAAELSTLAHQEIADQQVHSTSRASPPYAPGWPTHLQIVELLARELRAQLNRRP